MKRKISHCKVLEKINDNAYRICLPYYMNTFDIFNALHFTSYLKKEQNSRTSSFQPEENDVVKPTITSDSK